MGAVNELDFDIIVGPGCDLNAALEKGAGKRILVRAGTYKITRDLEPRPGSSVHWQGIVRITREEPTR